MASSITVEQISFRHDDRAAAIPLALRQEPVLAPEWQRGRSSRPAAYRIPAEPATVTVSAILRSHDRQLTSARVRARRAGGGVAGVGDIQPVRLRFGANGLSAETRCNVELKGNTGVGVETVEWIWERQSGTGWREVDRTTHEVALVLGEPRDPWSTDPHTRPGTTPWWEVMRLACDAAVGSRGPEDVMTRLTILAFHGWGGRFYRWGASTNYAAGYSVPPGAFDCARFLRLLDGFNEPEVLDCADTAAIVSTFAAVIGCPARQKAITVLGNTQPLLMVGRFQWRPPNGFGLHEFGMLEGRSPVWDACLELNTRDDLTRPAEPLLPLGVAPVRYLSLLLSQPGTMKSLGKEPISRSIGALERVAPARPADVLVQLSLAALPLPLDLLSFEGPAPRIARIDLGVLIIPGWTLVDGGRSRVSRETTSDTEPVARALWRRDADGQLVGCEVYLCADAQAARYRALALLGRLLPFAPRPDMGTTGPAGDEIVFSTSAGEAVVATRLNTAMQISGASRTDPAAETIRRFFEAVAAILTPEAPPAG